jgi:hypothetical protein
MKRLPKDQIREINSVLAFIDRYRKTPVEVKNVKVLVHPNLEHNVFITYKISGILSGEYVNEIRYVCVDRFGNVGDCIEMYPDLKIREQLIREMNEVELNDRGLI